jgi:hypothetical protein
VCGWRVAHAVVADSGESKDQELELRDYDVLRLLIRYVEILRYMDVLQTRSYTYVFGRQLMPYGHSCNYIFHLADLVLLNQLYVFYI